MTTATTNYGWGMPSDGGDFDNWGLELNAVIQAIDGQVKANDTAAQGYASAAQGTGLQKAQNLADLGSLAGAWANLGVAIASNGNGAYARLGPLMVMWGSGVGNSPAARTLPAAFSDYTRAVFVIGNTDVQGANVDNAWGALQSNTTYVTGTKQTNGGDAESGYPYAWIAIGPA